jgi:hypothetical protein
MDISWAYSGYILAFGVLWGGLYLLRPDLRKEMILMSLLATPLGPVGDFFYRADYYNLPNLNGEMWWLYSAAVGFVYGGVAAVIYEELKSIRHRSSKKQVRHPYTYLTIATIGIGFMVLAHILFDATSIYSSLIVMLAGGSFVLAARHDLIREAFGSGVSMAGVSALYYLGALMIFPQLFDEWNHAHLSGLWMIGIPVEEYAWAFAWGFIAGPAYEFALGVSEKGTSMRRKNFRW